MPTGFDYDYEDIVKAKSFGFKYGFVAGIVVSGFAAGVLFALFRLSQM